MRLRAAVACELEESFKKIAWILITNYIRKVHRYNIEIVTLHIARPYFRLTIPLDLYFWRETRD